MKNHFTKIFLTLSLLALMSALAVLVNRRIELHIGTEALNDWFPAGVPKWVDRKPVLSDRDGISLAVTTPPGENFEDFCKANGWDVYETWRDGFFVRQERIVRILNSYGVEIDDVSGVYVKLIDETDVGYLIVLKRRVAKSNSIFVLHRS